METNTIYSSNNYNDTDTSWNPNIGTTFDNRHPLFSRRGVDMFNKNPRPKGRGFLFSVPFAPCVPIVPLGTHDQKNS